MFGGNFSAANSGKFRLSWEPSELRPPIASAEESDEEIEKDENGGIAVYRRSSEANGSSSDHVNLQHNNANRYIATAAYRRRMAE